VFNGRVFLRAYTVLALVAVVRRAQRDVGHLGGSAIALTDMRLGGKSAFSLPPLASSNWYCLPIGIRPTSNHSDTAGALMPNTRAIAACVEKKFFASSGVMH
jgi:hypothetical protein